MSGEKDTRPIDIEKQTPALGVDDNGTVASDDLSLSTSSSRSAAERTLLRKQDLRIMPLTAAIYFLAYLDRSNIGNARVLNTSTKNDMQTETHTTSYQFTIALMIFLIGYFLFEVPSNILLKKFRPSRWIAFLMFAWGLITIGIGGVHNYGEITGVRFLLGVFEAGLFPGLVYYLTFWYKANERSVRVAFILASATLAGAFGGAIAFGVGHMNGARGLSGWRWLFILEGAPSVLSSFLVWFVMPDYPETTAWLSESEKRLAAQRLRIDGSQGSASGLTWQDAKETLMDWRLYAHYAIYFAVALPFSSLSLFSPTIIKGLGYQDLSAQLFSVPPWAIAYVVSILNSWAADRYNARGFYCAGAAVVGAAGFLASALLPPTAYASRYGTLIVSTSGAFASIPPMLGWLTSNIWNTSSVGLAVALNVSIGAGLGQIPGVWIFKAEEAKKGYPTGHGVNAATLFFVAIGAVGLRLFYGWRNKRILRAAAPGTTPRLYVL